MKSKVNRTEKTNNDQIKLYEVEDLDIAQKLVDKGANKKTINALVIKYKWVLHTIRIKKILDKSISDDDFIKLNRDVLRDILTKKAWETIRKDLKEWGYIEVNNYYRRKSAENPTATSESKGYRLTDFFNSQYPTWKLVTHNHPFGAKMFLKKQEAILKMDEVTKYVNLLMGDLSIRESKAKDWVQERLETGEISEHQAKCYLAQINNILNGLVLTNRSDKCRRIFTALSCLKKDLRQFLYLKNKPEVTLVSLDVANSQPFCLLKIIEFYYGKQGYIYGEYPEDVNLYIQLVKEGNFNNYMIDAFDIDRNDKKAVNEFKSDLFGKVFYCRNGYSNRTKEGKKFKDIFPNVYKIIVEEKKFDYTSLSIQLQKIEAGAIIDDVLNTLRIRYKDKVFFSPVHDSIICEEDYAEEVRELIKDAYELEVGFTPTIKPTEYLNKPQQSHKEQIKAINENECFTEDITTPEEVITEQGSKSHEVIALEEINTTINDILRKSLIEPHPTQELEPEFEPQLIEKLGEYHPYLVNKNGIIQLKFDYAGWDRSLNQRELAYFGISMKEFDGSILPISEEDELTFLNNTSPYETEGRKALIAKMDAELKPVKTINEVFKVLVKEKNLELEVKPKVPYYPELHVGDDDPEFLKIWESIENGTYVKTIDEDDDGLPF